ncbi:hypothetical protein Tco_1085221 [Tanacetum coccineum]
MVIVLNTTLEGTYQPRLSSTSKPSPGTIEFGEWIKLSDPKQALRGRHPMLIIVILCNFPDCDDSRALGFVLRSLELQILSFNLEIPISNLFD